MRHRNARQLKRNSPGYGMRNEIGGVKSAVGGRLPGMLKLREGRSMRRADNRRNNNPIIFDAIAVGRFRPRK